MILIRFLIQETRKIMVYLKNELRENQPFLY